MNWEYQVHFGKDKYHLHDAMVAWLRENVGWGGWIRNPNCLWNIECTFGNTTISFKNERDATMFILTWA